ncbi:hypothetical protein YIM73518_16730 [Thermus brockianus]
MGSGVSASVVSRRTWGPVPRGGFLLRRTEEEWARARTEAVERRVYGPPLDGWPFAGGEPSMASLGLGLAWAAEERGRVQGPPFGEVEF